MTTVRVFKYLDQLDAFVVSDEYRHLAEELGLVEWSPVVWIGRLFTLDNDYGEHWFDNWDEREALEAEAQKLGFDSEELMVIAPDRFKNDQDGPCHSPAIRKLFWTDVLKSLELSYEILFEVARQNNARVKEIMPEDFIEDLEERIAKLAAGTGEPAGNRPEHPKPSKLKPYTPKQGQYLAFIHHYTKIHGRPPAETDILDYFRTSPPAVHQMIVTLDKQGLIKRKPGQARTIRVLLMAKDLPELE